jgi:hypothetical protein
VITKRLQRYYEAIKKRLRSDYEAIVHRSQSECKAITKPCAIDWHSPIDRTVIAFLSLSFCFLIVNQSDHTLIVKQYDSEFTAIVKQLQGDFIVIGKRS